MSPGAAVSRRGQGAEELQQPDAVSGTEGREPPACGGRGGVCPVLRALVLLDTSSAFGGRSPEPPSPSAGAAGMSRPRSQWPPSCEAEGHEEAAAPWVGRSGPGAPVPLMAESQHLAWHLVLVSTQRY